MYIYIYLQQSVVPCPVLTVASWPAYRFLKKQVRWSDIPISFRIFHSLLWSTLKGFGIVNKAKIDVFLKLSCFSDDPADVGNLISGSSAFFKTSLNIWKFTVHILLKHVLEFTLAISGLLWLYTIFRVCWHFYRDYIESVDFFGILSIYLCLFQFLLLLMSFLNLNSFQKNLL